MVEKIADELIRTVEATARELKSLDPEQACKKPAPGKWSIQQILGHLLDSAVNNHHRFIRAQQQDEVFAFPDYEQDSWVALQGYDGSPWPELVELWQRYNRHLAQVIGRVSSEKLKVECRIGTYEPMTLGFLIEDYLVHMKHHLRQIEALCAGLR